MKVKTKTESRSRSNYFTLNRHAHTDRQTHETRIDILAKKKVDGGIYSHHFLVAKNFPDIRHFFCFLFHFVNSVN